MKKKYLIAILTCCAMLVSCKKDDTSRLEITTEPMGGGTKLEVGGNNLFWEPLDYVIINNVIYRVTTVRTGSWFGPADGHAYIEGVPLSDEYHGLYPSTIQYSSDMIIFPRTYEYYGNGNQLLKPPMEGYSTGGRMELQHLAGALEVSISNRLHHNLILDSIIVKSNKYCLSLIHGDWGVIDWPIAEIYGAPGLMNTSDKVSLQFHDENAAFAVISANDDISRSYIIPVHTVGDDNLFTITVIGHTNDLIETTYYKYQRTQSQPGALHRAVLAYVPVEMGSNSYTTISNEPFYDID